MQILQLRFTDTYDYHKDLRLSCHTYGQQDDAAVSVWSTRAWRSPLICPLWRWNFLSQMHTLKVTIMTYSKYILLKNIIKNHCNVTWWVTTIYGSAAAPRTKQEGSGQPRALDPLLCSIPGTNILYGTQDSSQHWPCMFGMQCGLCPLKRVGLQGSGPIVHWWSRKRGNPSCLSHEVGDHALGLRVKPLRGAGPSSGGRAHARLLLVAFILQESKN